MGIFDGFLSREKESYRIVDGGTIYTITEKGPLRFLKSNGIVYSELNKNSLYTHSYHDKFIPLPLLYDSPAVLVIGLCGGTIPYQLSKVYGKKVSIEVVDLNRITKSLAQRFLDQKINFRVVIAPGDKFVRRKRNGYDIIIQDAYVSDRIPKEFMGTKFIASAFKALKGDGILAINFAPDALYLPMYLHNLRKHFRYVYTISHIFLGNYIIICSKSFDKTRIVDTLASKLGRDYESTKRLWSYRGM